MAESFVTYYKPPTTSTGGNDAFINPFEETEEPPIDLNDTSNSTDNGADETGFQYKKFYVTRVVIIPCLVLMVIFSLIIVFIIMKQLRAIIKLYMSVIFYAFSIQYFAVMMVTLLVYDELHPDKTPNCDGAFDQMFTSFQLTGIIMPAMAVLAVTVVRVVFLSFPLRWREILTYRNQILGFCLTVLVTFILGFLPLMQLCELEMIRGQCVFAKSWSAKCVACFIFSLGFGLVAPKVSVAVMYCVIYGIVKKARKASRALSTLSTSLSRGQEIESVTASSEPDRKHSKNERRVSTERESFPWSIVVILSLNIISAIPWVILIGASELIYKKRDAKTFFLLDILYSLQLIATAASPIAYLLTTKVVRETTFQSFKKCYKTILKC